MDETEIYTGGGALLGTLPLSPQDKTMLVAGRAVTLTFHTPRMLQKSMLVRNFSLTLRTKGDRVTVDDPVAFGIAKMHLSEIEDASATHTMTKEDATSDTQLR